MEIIAATWYTDSNRPNASGTDWAKRMEQIANGPLLLACAPC